MITQEVVVVVAKTQRILKENKNLNILMQSCVLASTYYLHYNNNNNN